MNTQNIQFIQQTKFILSLSDEEYMCAIKHEIGETLNQIVTNWAKIHYPNVTFI